jgi:hypothetical protein
MEVAAIRAESIRKLSGAGVRVNPTLPPLETSLKARSSSAVIDRALALHAVVAASYGFPRDQATTWIEREGVSGSLTDLEREQLSSGGNGIVGFRRRVEALAALAWTVSVVPACDPFQKLPSSLVAKFPDLLRDEAASGFVSASHLRGVADLVAALDLMYCAHWALRQAELSGKRLTKLQPLAVVEERRRALEWVLSAEDWDELALDT